MDHGVCVLCAFRQYPSVVFKRALFSQKEQENLKHHLNAF